MKDLVNLIKRELAKSENQIVIDAVIATIAFCVCLYTGWGLIRSSIVAFLAFHFISPIPSKKLASWAFGVFVVMALTLAMGRKEFAEIFSQAAFAMLIVAVLTYFVRHDN